RQEYGTQSYRASDQAHCRDAESERHVEKDGVGSHGKAAALRRHATDGLNAEAGVDQRVTEAGECSASRGQSTPRRQPDERQAGRFDQYAHERDPRAAEPVRYVTEDQSSRNQRQSKDTEGEPDRTPSAFGGE